MATLSGMSTGVRWPVEGVQGQEATVSGQKSEAEMSKWNAPWEYRRSAGVGRPALGTGQAGARPEARYPIGRSRRRLDVDVDAVRSPRVYDSA